MNIVLKIARKIGRSWFYVIVVCVSVRSRTCFAVRFNTRAHTHTFDFLSVSPPPPPLRLTHPDGRVRRRACVCVRGLVSRNLFFFWAAAAAAAAATIINNNLSTQIKTHSCLWPERARFLRSSVQIRTQRVRIIYYNIRQPDGIVVADL